MDAATPAAPAPTNSQRFMRRLLRQQPNPRILELDWRAFRFETQITARRLGARAAGNLFAIDPQAHFAIDAANVIVVPFAGALAQLLARKAAAAVGRSRLKRRQLGGAGWKYVAIGRKKEIP